MTSLKRIAALAVLCCASFVLFIPSSDAAYPDRPIRVVLPYPAGTPQSVKATLNSALQHALKSPAAVRTLEQQGAMAQPMTLEQFRDFFDAERRRWHSVLEAAGVRPQ